MVYFVTAGCRPVGSEVPTREEIQLDQRPAQESWGARFSVAEGERPRVTILAGYMAKIEQADSTYLLLRTDESAPEERVTAFLFDEAGDSSAVLVADILYYYETERRFESRGNVIVDTYDNKRLETEHLVWDETDRKVTTPGFVRITTPKEQVQGYELDADEDLEHYTLSRVTGQVLVEEQ
ncbi:MAG: LPS export ABC transporter periplasmic protein LptC [Rhodothermales bacterium]